MALRHRGLAIGTVIASILMVAQTIGAPPAVAAEGSTGVIVVGGSAVIPDDMVTHLDSCTTDGVQRIAGSDRYETAAAIAGEWASADTVFLATGLNYPDALGGGPVAALNDAPILLTRKSALPAATDAELRRLAPSRIVLLGGTAVISTSIENDLRSRFPEIVRLAGNDRYATAAAVSRWHFTHGASTVYIATGLNFLDALVAGPQAAAAHAPLLLVGTDTVPAATATELDRLNPERIVLVGSSGVVSDSVKAELSTYADGGVTRVAGSSRYSTAAAVASQSTSSRVFIVTADDFPDGLAATPVTHGAPILFASASELNATTADAIAARTGSTCEPWVPPYPQVGAGKRIIYSNSAQRVWLIDANENLVDTYLVSGRVGIPHYATYSVFSKSVNAWAPYGGITMKYMVRFVRPYTWDNQWSYGFHAIPRYSNGQPMQTEDQLGTHRSGGCVRQSDAKAYALYQWADIGTTVHAIP